MGVQVTVKTGDDLKRISRGLGRMADGKRLKREFTKEIRAEVTPIARQVRAAYRSNPSKDQPNPAGRGDLRPMLARAVTVQVRTGGKNAGIILRVDGRKMPSGMGGVPRMYEGRERWRHPVHGNTNRWVSQKSVPTFDRIVPYAARRVRRRVERIAETTVRDVTKG